MDLAQRVLDLADLSIDTRRELGLPPRKLDPIPGRLLWERLTRHDGIIYCSASRSLHLLSRKGLYLIRRPVTLDYNDDGLFIFNNTEQEHMLEIVFEDGSFFAVVANDAWATEKRVMLI